MFNQSFVVIGQLVILIC